MGRRYNELYIGDEFLSTEGREIKHVGLLKEFGNTNVNKVTDTPIELTGTDIETNPDTAEMKLLGTWDGKKYRKNYGVNFVSALFNIIDELFWKGNTKPKHAQALAYWNKLDPFVLFKQFALMFEEDYQEYSMKRYGKISGEWLKKEGKWRVRPVVEVTVRRGLKTFKFGIKNVIRSSIQFHYYEIINGMPKQFDNGSYPLNTIWAYDIAPLYKNRLAVEMENRKHLFPYYSKIDESAHLVDWKRYERDIDYRHNIVDLSNEYDARAVYDLGTLIINDFYKTFHYYPRNLISAGSLARASITASFKHKYAQLYEDENVVNAHVDQDLKSIALINSYDTWHKQIGDEPLKDMFCLFYEAYSGGYIEAIRYGMIKSGYYSDIASAYIKYITMLLDLRESVVTYGEGTPPVLPDSYCFVRGNVKIPLGINYMPITVKHTTNKDTNIRATGVYRASYTVNEREYMIAQGAEFTDETWYNVQTKGVLSPLAKVATDLTALRYIQKANNDSAEFLTKTVTASIYGISFEATHTFYETDDLEILRGGYRGGEFLNPLYASWITAETRIQMSKATQCVDDNGGAPALMMTDCIFWEGEKDALDPEFIRLKKTLGYFEEPKQFTSMASLGTGRYSYVDAEKGTVTTKNRGLNVFDFHNPDGIDVDNFNWIEALKLAESMDTLEIKVQVRILVSVGMVLHEKNDKYDDDGNFIRKAYTVKDIGRVVTETRKVDLLTGLTKRILTSPKNIKQLSQGTIETESIYLGYGMDGGDLIDQTLPQLRTEVMKMSVKTAKKRDLSNRSKASYKYSKENKGKILKTERDKYKFLKDMGYSRDDAKKWCKRSYERIHNELMGGTN